MFSVQRFFSPPKRWPCQHINLKHFSRSSFAGRAWRAVFRGPVVVLGRRPSKTRGFLRFSNRPCDPLRTLGWSGLENSWFFAIFNSLARPSAEFRAVESLPLWRGAHFLEAANLKPLPSQWDLLQSVLSASSKSWPSHWNCFCSASHFLKTRVFSRFSIRPRDPLRSLGWSTLENSWFFAICKSLVRPSAEFRAIESLSLWRGAHFDEAARPKPLPSQWDLHQRKLAASLKPSPSHGNCF